MPVAKGVTAQLDFSGGEADIWLKRSDDNPMLKKSGRQMSNWRLANAGAMFNRPGRRVLGIEGVRAEEIVLNPTNNFSLVFGNGYLRVYNQVWTKVFDSASSGITIPWTAATTDGVIWDIYKNTIYICYGDNFPNNVPLVLTWDGVGQSSIWTLTRYAPRTTSGGQKRTIFYRLSPLGVTCQPFLGSGNIIPANAAIAVNFSVPTMVAGQENTLIRYANRQILLTNTSVSVVSGIAQESIPWTMPMTALDATTPKYSDAFAPGDELIGSVSGAKVIVDHIAGLTVFMQHLTFTEVGDFTNGEVLVGPTGSVKAGNRGTAQGPSYITVWDDEVMNNYRGWPRSCFVDQGRLGFCDFPALPGLVAWSAVGDFTDFYTDENNVAATSAIQELAPGKSRVLYVVPGPEGSEFVFCDNAVYYIPINQTTPLKPGSVAFNTLSSAGAAQVQPRRIHQSIVYIGAGDQQMKAIQAIGAYNRPYIVDDLTELHSHLINNPVTIATPGGSDQFEENYIYALNGDATLMVAKFNLANGLIDTKNIGWVPWSGGGKVRWVSALLGHPDVLMTSLYTPGGAATVSVVEQLDNTQYLDAAMLYNTVPASLTPPGGKGPLWWLANGRVDLMDGLRMMGTYTIDANGYLVPQNNAGEDFTSATLTVGQAWTATFEPWVPAVSAGQDVNQRLRKRRIQRFEVYVQNSSGFTMVRFFGGPITSTSPAVGTVMQVKRIPAWNQDDDPTVAPPLREQTYSTRPTGRNHDPRVGVIKDTPGPLIILEADLEVSV